MNPKNSTYQRYGNIIINKSQPLGSGNFGHVWRGYLISPNNTLQPVAIKQSYNQTQNIKQIQTLQILKHENIIQYRDYRLSGNLVFMVMQLCQGGTLDDLLYSMHEHDTDKIISIYVQIIRGIRFMYEKKILHRDIKPSNILVNKRGVIKIADFGTSKINNSQIKLKTLVGTPLFFSPELLEMCFGQKDNYTEKSQIWALGLILYYMFNYQYNLAKSADRMKESLPWPGRNTGEIFKNIKTLPLKFKKPQRIPIQIQQIITKMLKINAEQRMSFQDLFKIQIFNPKQSTLPHTHPSHPLQSSQIQQQIQQNLSQQKLEQKTINPISRQTIDWQLLQLLQKKDQQSQNKQQIQQYRQFYQILIQQLQEIYDIKYYQLMYQLEFIYYQLTDKIDQKGKILYKYHERKNKFKEIDQKQKEKEKEREKVVKNPSLINNNNNNSNNSGNINMIGLDQDHTQKLIYPIPNDKLLSQSKTYIKDNIHKIIGNKMITNFSQQHKKIIYLIYDLFTLITFQKSWQIKKKTKASILEYKKIRKQVRIQTIVIRIIKAIENVKI